MEIVLRLICCRAKPNIVFLRNFGASRKTTFCIFGNFPDEKIRPQMHHQPRCHRQRRVHLTHLHFFFHPLSPLKYRNTLFSGSEFRDGFISGRWNDLGRREANYSGGSFGRNVSSRIEGWGRIHFSVFLFLVLQIIPGLLGGIEGWGRIYSEEPLRGW